MSCQTVRKFLSEYLDQRLGAEPRMLVTRHLARCRACATLLEELSGNRAVARSLPMARVPQHLQTQLLVLASRERSRWNATRTLDLTLRGWAQNLRLAADNLMRPLALPFAGGLLSALFLFAMLVPTLGYRPAKGTDVPTGLYTAATLVSVTPFGFNEDETVVTMYVDERGQAMDYSVERGTITPEVQADITKMMVFSRFTPATWFGQPTNGKVVVSFRRINYVVRG